jgi:hypothetical protein
MQSLSGKRVQELVDVKIYCTRSEGENGQARISYPSRGRQDKDDPNSHARKDILNVVYIDMAGPVCRIIRRFVTPPEV